MKITHELVYAGASRRNLVHLSLQIAFIAVNIKK